MLEASRTIKAPMAMRWSTWSRLWSRGHSWPGRFPHWKPGHRTWALLFGGAALCNIAQDLYPLKI